MGSCSVCLFCHTLVIHHALDLLFVFIQRVGWGYVCPVKHEGLDLLSVYSEGGVGSYC